MKVAYFPETIAHKVETCCRTITAYSDKNAELKSEIEKAAEERGWSLETVLEPQKGEAGKRPFLVADGKVVSGLARIRKFLKEA